MSENLDPSIKRRRRVPDSQATPTESNGSSSAAVSSSSTSRPNPRLFPKIDENATPDRPCHAAQDSLFSSSSGYTNYRGFFNLCLILLTLSNVRVALENVIKYGILVSPSELAMLVSVPPHKLPVFWLILLSNVFILSSLYVEKLMVKGKLSDRHGLVFYAFNLASVLIVPAAVILLVDSNPFWSFWCLGFYTVLFLKLISFGHVNYWCRLAQRQPNNLQQRQQNTQQNGHVGSSSSPLAVAQQSLVKYPDNLTVQNLYYFLFAPTLCYELNFPRSPRRRKLFIVKRSIEVLFIVQAAMALCQQWIVPLLKNSLEPFIAMNYSRMLERLLKLAVPNHLIWLMMFYWLFHSCLNLTAEWMRFADRQFYRDWWNAENIQYFWQNWNIPVHKWCVRHLYKPMINAGFTKFQGGCAVFAMSAFFHEYLISVPLHLFRVWAFTGMLTQIPLNLMTSYLIKGRWGNITVWLSLILGQPLCILMYVHDWYVQHYMQQSSMANSTIV